MRLHIQVGYDEGEGANRSPVYIQTDNGTVRLDEKNGGVILDVTRRSLTISGTEIHEQPAEQTKATA